MERVQTVSRRRHQALMGLPLAAIAVAVLNAAVKPATIDAWLRNRTAER